MTLPRQMARRLPLPVQRSIRLALAPRCSLERHRLIRRLRSETQQTPSEAILRRLLAAWNSGGAADIGYLQEMIVRARCAKGSVLECGSGLTTLLLGMYAAHPVVALEENWGWYKRMKAALSWYGLDNVELIYAPIRSYDEGFSWFDIARMPDGAGPFHLVICDGPVSRPEYLQPARYGLVPLLQDRLWDATIMLDDVERSDEQEILRRWCHQGWSYVVPDRPGRDFAVLVRAGDR